MKNIFLLLLIPMLALCQDKEDYCLTRGHVAVGKKMADKLVPIEPYVLDRDTATWIIYPSNDVYRYKCLRCSSYISEFGSDKKVLIWRRK